MIYLMIGIACLSAIFGYMAGFMVCERFYINAVKSYDERVREYRSTLNKVVQMCDEKGKQWQPAKKH